MVLAPPRLSVTIDTGNAPFPPEVDLILSAMNAGQFSGPTRRAVKRVPYRVRGQLRLFSDASAATVRTIYTRDANSRGLGFLTQHRLPLGHGGVVELPTPGPTSLGGEPVLQVACTLLRCREAAPGWFEGSVYFNREQAVFAVLE